MDLVHQGEKQSIDYVARGIAHVMATDTATPDVSHLGSLHPEPYDVLGVPDHIHVDLQGAQDITYSANAKIPTSAFSTKTLADLVLQQEIDANRAPIPKSVHVTNVTTAGPAGDHLRRRREPPGRRAGKYARTSPRPATRPTSVPRQRDPVAHASSPRPRAPGSTTSRPTRHRAHRGHR